MAVNMEQVTSKSNSKLPEYSEYPQEINTKANPTDEFHNVRNSNEDLENGEPVLERTGSKEQIIIPDQFGSSFSSQEIRARFIRKVYLILMGQFAIVTALVLLASFVPQIRSFYCLKTDYLNGYPECREINITGLYIYLSSFVIFIILFYTIHCFGNLRKTWPYNFIFLLAITLSLSLVVSSISLYHNFLWVAISMGLTFAFCLGLTLFSLQTKIDLTGKGMYIFAFGWMLFLFGILLIIFFLNSWPIMHTIYAVLVGLLYSLYFVYDTQLIMGKGKYSISPEEHILAAIHLFVDVMYIFMIILRLGRR